MADLIVTIQAIIGYLAKAREAKEQLNEANADMKNAAEQLCSIWQGDASNAFAAEQGVLNTWVNEMISIGAEYMDLLSRTAAAFEEMDAQMTQAVTGK